MLDSFEEVRHDSLAKKLLRAAQYVLILVFGLLPILVLPGVEAPLTYSKVGFVLIAVLLSVILFSFSLLRSGSFTAWFPIPVIAFAAFVVSALVSALLSGDIRDSLIGNSFEVQTVAFVALLLLVTLTWMYIGQHRETVFRAYTLLLVSAIALAAFHILRIFFGADFLSFGMFPGAVLSPIGAWNNLALFFGLAIIISLIALEQLPLPMPGRALLFVVVAASLVMLAIVNLFPVWIVLGTISLIVLVYGLARDRLATGQRGVLPRSVSVSSLFIAFMTLLTSVAFVVSGPVIGGAVSRITEISYIEVRPSLSATADIVGDVYRESPFTGVGPNRFIDAWRSHREPEINSTVFWNTDFSAGYGYVPTFFVTTGAVGGILILAFFATFLYSGVRFLIQAPGGDRVWYFVGTASFAAATYLWGMSFVYMPGPVLLILAAMSTGAMYAAYAALVPERTRTVTLGASPRTNFILVGSAVVAVGASIVIAYSVGQHYLAAHYYSKAAVVLNETGDVAAASGLVARAYSYAQDDLFARRVAEYEGIRLSAVLSSTSGDQASLQALFQEVFNNGVAAARTATELDSSDANNWSVLGSFYAAVTQFNITGVYEEAKAALTKARELDPNNPARVLALAQLELIKGNTGEARLLAEDALRMKQNYSDAIYMIAQLDILAGNVDGAIAAAEAVTLLEPDNPVRYFQLGVLQLTNNEADDARASLERAVALNSDYANARYFLAFAYDALDRSADAERELSRVLELNPDNQVVTDLLARLKSGQPLSEPPQASTSTAATPPVEEENSGVSGDDTVVSDEAPDSPLLAPLNVGADTDGEGE